MSGRYTPPAVPLLRHLSVREEVEHFRVWAERIGDPELLALVAHTAELFERAGWTLEINAMRSLEALGRARAAWEVKELIDAAKSADCKSGGKVRGAQNTEEAAAIRVWLWPLLWESDQELIAERRPRGWEYLKTEAELRLMPDDPRRGKVSERRVKQWIGAGRPRKAPE